MAWATAVAPSPPCRCMVLRCQGGAHGPILLLYVPICIICRCDAVCSMPHACCPKVYRTAGGVAGSVHGRQRLALCLLVDPGPCCVGGGGSVATPALLRLFWGSGFDGWRCKARLWLGLCHVPHVTCAHWFLRHRHAHHRGGLNKPRTVRTGEQGGTARLRASRVGGARLLCRRGKGLQSVIRSTQHHASLRACTAHMRFGPADIKPC